MPEKVNLLGRLKTKGFNVPDFIYVPADRFEIGDFDEMDRFLKTHQESFKVIARSTHPDESYFKGGTFDSLETYADVAGIKYARNRMIKLAKTSKRLSILRQQRFGNVPEIDLNQMGVIVMPFVDGASVMAKMIQHHWEFGYCRNRSHKVQIEPYVTKIPHDRRLLELSESIQKCLGFKCEIEYIISSEGKIYVVQAKDISQIEMLEKDRSLRSIRLDGVRRIRKSRNYRERPVYVMDNKSFYINVISKCEELVHEEKGSSFDISEIVSFVKDYERDMEDFALTHQRFAVLGFSVQDPKELYQIANHYLDDYPELQKPLSKALHNNLYNIDIFLAEADTLIMKNKFRINLCSHDAYGIDTVRFPVWSVYWNLERHDDIVSEFRRLGFKTGDTIGIEIDAEECPEIIRL